MIKAQKLYCSELIICIRKCPICTETISDYTFSIVEIIFMSRYSITKKRAENLECHRANNGPYKSLEDLLQVKGMNDKCLYKFYKSIICGKRTGPKKITRGLVLTPKPSNQKVCLTRNQT